MEDIKIYQAMHMHGKLTSCNAESPHAIDKLFVKKLKEILEE